MGAEDSRDWASGQRLIWVGVAGFVVSCVVLFALAKVFEPSADVEVGHAIKSEAETLADGVKRMTLDARSAEEWTTFSLVLGRKVPEGPAADISVQRFNIQARRGALDLGKVPFEQARVPPDPEWEQDVVIDGVKRNPALSSWYSYSMMTHLLRPKDKVLAVRLQQGVAYMQVQSYYCEPEDTGCLTFRYRIEAAD